MIYKKVIRPIFFLVSPESIHHFVISSLKVLFSIPFLALLVKKRAQINNHLLVREVFGLKFQNPVGLAAGFDKDAQLFNELSNFGFGFIEVGTLTPKAQPGNEKPRMFRLPQANALINRMGFNNGGVQQAAMRLKNKKSRVLIGGNIGKNKITPNELANEDYLQCFKSLYEVVDFFVVNVSSPNTPGLRALQEKAPLTELLSQLKQLNNTYNLPKPILIKIAPDLTNQQLDDIIDIVIQTKIDGVIATNTTIDRSLLNHLVPVSQLEAIGAGGLSGKPLLKRSLEVVNYLSTHSNKAFPIIGVGGIHSPEDAIAMLNAGASLVQVYTGFIYEGPGLIRRINKAILEQGL